MCVQMMDGVPPGREAEAQQYISSIREGLTRVTQAIDLK